LYTKFQRPGLDSFVGPEALTLFNSGWKLTESRLAPSALNLK
jgi:hypothetical protein